MGQYYKVINIDKKEYMRADGGVKLMEWSYNLNPLILNLINKMANEWKGNRVYVVGDYAVSSDDEESYDYKKLVELEKDLGIYNKKDSQGYKISIYDLADKYKKIDLKDMENEEYKYIYNHNKKQYINLEHCPLAWLYKDKSMKKYETVRISPVSLLLTLGNGRGGGDYRGHNDCLIGYYLDDVTNLEITKEQLNNDYTEFRPEFYEEEYIPFSQIEDYIKITEDKNVIAKELVQFIKDFDEQEYKEQYANKEEQQRSALYKMNYHTKEQLEQIRKIILKNDNAKAKILGEKLIEKVKSIVVKEAVKDSLNKIIEKIANCESMDSCISELYKIISEDLKIKNIEEIQTINSNTTIKFETQEKIEITTNDINNEEKIIENAKILFENSLIQKKAIKFTEIDKRIPNEDRFDDLYYYEYRGNERKETIERNTFVDFKGTLITNKNILDGKDYIEYDDLFNNPEILMLDDSDMYNRVSIVAEEIEDEMV